jgi:hypothetical protein
MPLVPQIQPDHAVKRRADIGSEQLSHTALVDCSMPFQDPSSLSEICNSCAYCPVRQNGHP